MDWHVHVYFDDNTKSHAQALYRDMGEIFLFLELGKIHHEPVGPHTKPQFRALVPDHEAWRLVSWLAFYRRDLSVLVHPCTGDELRAHRDQALWLGTPVPLDLEKL